MGQHSLKRLNVLTNTPQLAGNGLYQATSLLGLYLVPKDTRLLFLCFSVYLYLCFSISSFLSSPSLFFSPVSQRADTVPFYMALTISVSQNLEDSQNNDYMSKSLTKTYNFY